MLLSELGQLGAPEVLDDAARIVAQRGMSLYFPRCPDTGGVSAVGALAYACGAKNKDMDSWDGNLEFAPIPTSSYALFMELITYLESFTDREIDNMSIYPNKDILASVLSTAANRIRIAVI